MTTAAVRASVIVASRHRAAALARCLTGLAQLDHPDFEVIVVADPEGLAVTEGLVVKRVAFDAPNISAARNAGLAQAAAPVVAFIDDDAVPEPTWLCHLTAPFADERVAAAGGFVRGRNGISFQWKASCCDRLGQTHPLTVDETAPSLHASTADRAIRTEGTNCAFRRDAILRIGGFDPSFQFYLDETDLNMRLAVTGCLTAIVPGAQVHHGFAASARRAMDRAPTDLHQIGASMAVFWRKYAPAGTDLKMASTALIARQRDRLLRYMIDGALEPQEVAPILSTLCAGLDEGRARPLADLAPLPPGTAPYLRFPAGPHPRRVIAGRVWQAWRKRRAAARAAARGEVITLLLFGPSIRRHRQWFHPLGYWEQNGGLWGRTEREESLFQRFSFESRLRQERARLAEIRNS
ncbi:MAG: glycosyltransferase family 2 protein [Paracoccaceae bacterium]|nr:glycosyltransferase family 2 protein [Paracoccaceae bacterium]